MLTIEEACALSILPVDPEQVAAYVERSTVTLEGTTRYAVVDMYATPAEGTAVARVLLGTADVTFSHMGMGAYPVYTPAMHDHWGTDPR